MSGADVRSLNRGIAVRHRKKEINSGVLIMKHPKKLEDEISAWPSISVHPHRFGGKEFLFGSAEVGHIHTGGIVDIPFPRAVRYALKTASDPREMLEQESAELNLSPEFKSLLERFVRETANQSATEPLSAA